MSFSDAGEVATVLAPRLVAIRTVVRDNSGTPIEGAVVVTSAGGRAVTDKSGEALIPVTLTGGVDSLHVTAAASIAGVNYAGSKRASVAPGSDDPAGAEIEAGVLTLTEGAQPEPQWLPMFGPAAGLDDTAFNMIVFDDGSGPALYVSGAFRIAGGAAASRIAKWDGASWSPLGSGASSGNIRGLAVFDDGSGPALFVGGNFAEIGGVAASSVAKWDGVQWSPLGSGLVTIPLGSGPFAPTPSGTELMVFDDGTGPALYVSGRFQFAGGVAANNIAKWDGAQWSPLGAGLVLDAHPAETGVAAMAVFDDGAGPALYAAGSFTSAGAIDASNIARWDGVSWSRLGSGTNGDVFDLRVFDDGSGPALYAGGEFTSVGLSVSANSIAKWDGLVWSPLGQGLSATVANVGPPSVFALEVFDDGSGPALYAGGVFLNSGPILDEAFVRLNFMAKWDRATWSPLGGGLYGGVDGLAVFDDGSGPALYAGGLFTADMVEQDFGLTRGDTAINRIARWDGQAWSPVGDNNGLNGTVLSTTVFDDGAGPAVYAGGVFVTAGGTVADRIAKWDGDTWTPLAGGLGSEAPSAEVNALEVFDNGGGASLYAGGRFGWTKTPAGETVTVNNIARWDGVSWSPVGDGVGGGSIFALAVFDDGSGPALYAGGDFTSAGGAPASRIARWDGAAWSSLGSGISGRVAAMAVFDDGSGPALYVGGIFGFAGGVPANRIAKWDGAAWSFVGAASFNNGVAGGVINSLAVFDDASGPALYVGGSFTSAGGVPANRIAKWDGAEWSPVGSSSADAISFVLDLAAFDDGAGPALYAGGTFASIGGVAANNIARWDGAAWSPIGAGVNSSVRSLTTYNAPDGASLVVAGAFAESPAGDSFVARIAAASTPTPDLNNDGTVNGTDLLILLNEFGGPGAADLNNDGTVNGTDLLILLNAFGTNG